MRFPICLSVLMLPVMALAGPREDAEAALALSKAKATYLKKLPAHVVAVMPYEQAQDKALKEGKPCVVRVGGIDCSATCPEFGDKIVVGTVDRLNGSNKPRIVLSFPFRGVMKHWCEFEGVPTVDQLNREIESIGEWKSRQPPARGIRSDQTSAVWYSVYPADTENCSAVGG